MTPNGIALTVGKILMFSMRSTKLSIVFLLAFSLGACHSDSVSKKGDISIVKADTVVTVKKDTSKINIIADTVQDVKLEYGFEARFIDGETRRTDMLHLYRNGKLIFTTKNDSTVYAYSKGEHLYPIINKFNDNTFELIVRVDDRPLKDKATIFRIENDKLISKKPLPTFITNAFDLDGDGILEYAGALDASEEFGIKGVLCRSYDPILYYKLSQDGLVMDTSMTKERNTIIYGKFYGFSFDGKTGVPIASGVNERYDKEYAKDR
jgi:hypothetical protein